jgi:hypothetical protein
MASSRVSGKTALTRLPVPLDSQVSRRAAANWQTSMLDRGDQR